MATDTAALPTAAPADPTRHLWQLPVLLLGLGVFLATWQGWLNISRADPEDAFARDVAALKAEHEKLTPDPVVLKTQLNKVAGGVEGYPRQAAPARFHLGSGYARLAELTPNPDEARGYWTLARQHLDIAEKQLRDGPDAPKVAFRAAKARAAVGLPADTPVTEIVLLMTVLSAPPPGEDTGETYRLIADLSLRLDPPDVARAKAALGDYLRATGYATPVASLARARLRLGDLYLREREYASARKWLEQVGTDTPPDVLVPAKVLLAQVLMAEGNFPAAAKEWELLRGAPNIPAGMRLTATYQLGGCKLKAGEAEVAARLFEEAAKGEGPEAAAAAVRLAELHLRAPDPARHRAAADLLAAAVKGVRTPADFDTALVPLGEVQAAFESAVATLLADKAHEPALKAADSYKAVAATGRDREKRAEVLAAWAGALRKTKAPEAKAKFKAAADEFAAVAAFQAKADGKLEMLRQAAANYRQAEEPAAAAKRLEEALALPDVPEPVLAALWVELADALIAANRPEDVFRIFNKVMAATDTPLSTATRYRLARQFTDTRHPGLVPLGRALFEQIAKQRDVSAAEREFHERALTELANALIREGNFADAEGRLRTQLNIYPNGPEAGLARLLLGVCLLQRAAGAAAAPADAAKMRAEAVTTFKQIVAECDAAERRAGKLTDREAWLRLQAALRVLQAHQQTRTAAAARELLYESVPLLDRYKGTVEELIVLSLMYHAFRQLNDPGKALDTRDRMKEAFDKLGPSAFPQDKGEYSRDYWLQVWFPPEKKKE
jgi:TolA-binding protein